MAKTVAAFIGFVAVCCSASAMTFEEFKSAIANAEPGSVIAIDSDIVCTEILDIKKTLTIESSGEGRYSLVRGQGLNGLFAISGSGVVVTLQNIAIDGNIAAGKFSNHLVTAIEYSKLVLGQGASIANGLGRAVSVAWNGELHMQEGSSISNFTAASGQYGIAILLGLGATHNKGIVHMSGGTITGCKGGRTAGLSPDWDGAVYLYGGEFHATGGTITGNVSGKSVAGINCYSGRLLLSGSFTATNNIGGCGNDVMFHYRSGNEFQATGDYTGAMTLKIQDVDAAQQVYVPSAGDVWKKGWTSKRGVALRGWEQCRSEDNPELGLNFRDISESWYPTWFKPDFGVQIAGKWGVPSFSQALIEADAGDAIELLKDMQVEETVDITKDVTIRSAKGVKCTIWRTSADMTLFKVSGAKLAFSDIDIDGAELVCSSDKALLEVVAGGELTLGRGTVVANAITKTSNAGVLVTGSRSKLVMEEGSLITNCQTTVSTPYGTTVRVGNSSSYAQNPTFEMRGGVIADCVMNNYKSGNADYGGVVYLWNGVFDMSGGAITNNHISPATTVMTTCSGVVNYIGVVRLSGSAEIADNDGANPGLRLRSSQTAIAYGELCGRVQFADASAAEGTPITGLSLEGNARGVWCIHSDDGSLVGRLNEDSTLVWAAPIGSVGGVKAATQADLLSIIPSRLVIDAASVGKLPIVLDGEAIKLGKTIVLDYDQQWLKDSGNLPLQLVKAEGDGEIAGEWVFEHPLWPRGGQWFVRSSASAKFLDWSPSGIKLIVR